MMNRKKVAVMHEKNHQALSSSSRHEFEFIGTILVWLNAAYFNLTFTTDDFREHLNGSHDLTLLNIDLDTRLLS